MTQILSLSPEFVQKYAEILIKHQTVRWLVETCVQVIKAELLLISPNLDFTQIQIDPVLMAAAYSCDQGNINFTTDLGIRTTTGDLIATFNQLSLPAKFSVIAAAEAIKEMYAKSGMQTLRAELEAQKPELKDRKWHFIVEPGDRNVLNRIRIIVD